jgi:moderate conductance mechanosensitive channel
VADSLHGCRRGADVAGSDDGSVHTKPGEQFVIRRRAYAMIKKAFAEDGIEIAIRTVQVAGGSEGSTPAAARQGLELIQQPPVIT